MIIIGSGSRDWKTSIPIKKVMRAIKAEFQVFTYYHGDQRGFDLRSAWELTRLGHTDIIPFPYISELGKAGGMARNQQMLDAALTKEKPHDILLIAMPLETSIGTYGMISICKNDKYAGIRIRIYDSDGNLV